MNDMTAPAGIGHNTGRVPTPEDIREVLAADHADMIARRDELLAGLDRAPKVIESDEVAGRVSDFTKQVMAHAKKVDVTRVDAKEPFLAGGRAVDGFFRPIADSLDAAKKDLGQRITVWQRKKADDERRAREAAEAKARAEAEAARRAAEEAAARMRSETDLDAALAAEEAARRAAEEAAKAERAADASAADLSRTRGDYGAVASLRTTWAFEIDDADKIPLDLIRPYIPRAALEQAIRGFIKAGGRQLAGARIFPDTNAVIR
jgi:hypothetical protein